MILNAKQIINFTSKITLDKTTGCWNWNGCKSAKGYGRFQLLGKTYNAHRISYVIHGGTLLTGKEIDHKCRNRSCVNPFHLQQISHKENVLIGESLQAKNKRKTHCIRGHEFTDSNTYFRKDGGRTCNTCRNIKHKLKRKN